MILQARFHHDWLREHALPLETTCAQAAVAGIPGGTKPLARTSHGRREGRNRIRERSRERLRSLDNRVLKMDRRETELATEAGWRRQAARWRWMALTAALFLLVPFVAAALNNFSLYGLMPMGGVLAFQAGRLKAEDDRLNRRGPLERLRPAGL